MVAIASIDDKSRSARASVRSDWLPWEVSVILVIGLDITFLAGFPWTWLAEVTPKGVTSRLRPRQSQRGRTASRDRWAALGRILDYWNTCAKHDSLFHKFPFIVTPLFSTRLKNKAISDHACSKNARILASGISWAKFQKSTGRQPRLVVKSRSSDFCHLRRIPRIAAKVTKATRFMGVVRCQTGMVPRGQF
jgi:hypothetical protein